MIPFKLDHLVVLRAAARKGTFAEVAKELGVTAARVTMSVQDLEKAMKCR